MTSQLNSAIREKFRAHDIEIPFPQTDLHIRSDSTKPKPAAPIAHEPEPDDFNELVETETENDNR